MVSPKSDTKKLDLVSVTNETKPLSNTLLINDVNTPKTISNSLKIQDLLNQGSLGKTDGTASAITATTSNAAASSNASTANASGSTTTPSAGTGANTAAKTSGAGEAPIIRLLRPVDPVNDRFKSETVRKNWKNVLDVAMKKKNELMENDMNSSSMNRSSYAEPREIYATDKENWIFFSIIIAIVIVVSVLFCFIVYWFFPQFRAKPF
jgi:hypothetical protein